MVVILGSEQKFLQTTNLINLGTYDVIYVGTYNMIRADGFHCVPQREVELKPLTLPLYSPRVTKKETVISFPAKI